MNYAWREICFLNKIVGDCAEFDIVLVTQEFVLELKVFILSSGNVAGTIPVVVGAPNIQDFSPSLDSVLHIKQLSDVALVAKTMKHLAANPDAFNQSLR